VIAEGSEVVVECVSSTTTADGRPYRNEIVSLFTVQDGRIRSMREYFDTQYVAQTLFA
jgi:ketosteroid isomerase-like protein